MTTLGLKPELRSEDTIRAYLEELARLKAPVQFWIPGPGALPFESTLELVAADHFTTTTTPVLEPGQSLNLAFMLDARRFTSQTQVVATGSFRIPISVAHGERRAHPRAPFQPSDRAEVLLVEGCAGTFAGGRTLQGRLQERSAGGLRMTADEFDVLTGPVRELKPGDHFQAVRITGLPHMPPVQCQGALAHLTGLSAGLVLDGLTEAELKNLGRVLAPRFPPSFGLDFPARKRRTDLGDRLGAPTATKAKAKAPEVVERPLEAPPPEPEPAAPAPVTAIMRLRKLARRILLLSPQASTRALAEAIRQDGFRHVFEATNFKEAQTLARSMRFDLVVLDDTQGGRWAQDMMKALRGNDLLVGTAVILVVDSRNTFTLSVAQAVEAFHIHERRTAQDGLLPVLHQALLEGMPG